MASYGYKQEGEKYVIYADDFIVTTPAGNNVTTVYKPIADRIVSDLKKYIVSVIFPASRPK